MGLNVGAAYSFRNNTVNEHFGNSIGFNFGFDFSYKNSMLYINTILSGGDVDRTYTGRSYWLEYLDFTLALIDVSYGYAILDNSALKISPFAGLAITEFSENDYDNKESDLRMHTIPSVFLSKRESIGSSSIRSRWLAWLLEINFRSI